MVIRIVFQQIFLPTFNWCLEMEKGVVRRETMAQKRNVVHNRRCGNETFNVSGNKTNETLIPNTRPIQNYDRKCSFHLGHSYLTFACLQLDLKVSNNSKGTVYGSFLDLEIFFGDGSVY